MIKQLAQYLSVAAGGCLGAVLRHYAGVIFRAEILPLGTLTVNLLGSGILGFFLTMTLGYWKIPSYLKLGAVTGLLGSFTTYATFSVDCLSLWNAGHYFTAVFYVLANFLGGFILAYGGIRLAELLQRRHQEVGGQN